MRLVATTSSPGASFEAMGGRPLTADGRVVDETRRSNEGCHEEPGVGLVGISPERGGLDRAVVAAYRSAVTFVRLICPRVSWGQARNLVTLLGHTLTGQAAALTAESTAMIFFKEADLGRLFRATGEVLPEILEVLFPEVR